MFSSIIYYFFILELTYCKVQYEYILYCVTRDLNRLFWRSGWWFTGSYPNHHRFGLSHILHIQAKEAESGR